ncbi:sodium- and chloride-dependent neutral and basic amino acid transporter B(0+)-like [Leucoraja erinacea]|uniref:sodium- and chloride-dependent neutral and basic amino acid transporter B(0+)-like n=1 Tax=Leucoraja erinaceus TaxID=7782 RepID=UPI0024584C0F|nr:sodium- and chloride-dependent neutral and basic amino acid transporter B(0+)-like [Leucoraja erinacea]
MDERVFALSDHDYQAHSPGVKSSADEHVGDENVERGNWSSKTDYLLSMIGCAVGLGNVWRFPYLAYRNGGGAFLIPYTLMLVMAGMPVFFLESSLGQFASRGCVRVWKAVPILQGVGITMMIMVTFSSVSYNCIIAYSLFYLFASFQSPLPWSDCFSWWGADETCSRTPRGIVLISLTVLDQRTTGVGIGPSVRDNGAALTVSYLETAMFHLWLHLLSGADTGEVASDRWAGTCVTVAFDHFVALVPDFMCCRSASYPPGVTLIICMEMNLCSKRNVLLIHTPHFPDHALQTSLWMKSDILMKLLITTMKTLGLREANNKTCVPNLSLGSRKRSHVTSPSPSRGWPSPDGGRSAVAAAGVPTNSDSPARVAGLSNTGAANGRNFNGANKVALRRSSSMDETGEIVWHLALCLLLAWLIVGATLSKGIKSSGKVVYFTATFPYVVLAVLLIRGLTLEGARKGIEFYIGSQSDFSKLADAEFHCIHCSGFALVFIAYPEALAQLPWAPLWSTLFFFMLLTLGLDTQFAAVEIIITNLVDQFPKLLQSKRFYLTAGVCSLIYFLGLVFVTEAGIYWINLIDYFCTGWILIIVALLELIGLSWIYGVNRFIKDIEMMIGERSWLFWLWWKVCWCFISPCLLVVILAWSLATFTQPTFGHVQYPIWAVALGWCMIIFCIMWIPIIAIVRVFQAEGSTLYQKLSTACSSAPDWGPYLEKHRDERYRNKTKSTEVSNQLLVFPTEIGTFKEVS